MLAETKKGKPESIKKTNSRRVLIISLDFKLREKSINACKTTEMAYINFFVQRSEFVLFLVDKIVK